MVPAIINKGALPQVDDLNIVSAHVTLTDDGGRVDFTVTGNPTRVRRFQEALLAQTEVVPPILGLDTVLAFTFVSINGEELLTTATRIMIDAMDASKLPTVRETLGNDPAAAGSTGESTTTERRRERPAPRRRMPVTNHRR